MTRAANLHQFTSFDGTPLVYRHWPAATPSDKHVMLFHRGHEHGGRQQHIVDELNAPDTNFYAWDARGHGLNDGPRGYAPHFGALVQDAQAFFEHLQREHSASPEQVAVIAQSVGAVIAATWVHDYAPRLRALVLASPAFSVKLYVPGAIPGLTLLQSMRGTFFVNSYVKAKFLTHDPARQQSFNEDPLITRPIASNVLLDLYKVSSRIVADAQAIQVPTLLLVSGSDFVVRKAPQKQFFDRLGSKVKNFVELPGFYHDTLGERDRGPVMQGIRDFLATRFAEPVWTSQELLKAHETGYTFQEYAKLKKPLGLSPKAAMFKLTRLLMAGPGRMSKGVQTGFNTGFDSGSMLDYVYQNTAKGLGPVGRFIDRQYLNAVGWVGIRQRRVNIAGMIERAVGELRQKGLPVRIVDIAAGHGRYVLDALVKVGLQPGDSVLLRDYSSVNVAAGRELIQQLGLADMVRFEVGDAFDEASLAQLTPSPTLAIVSGLYELFPSNPQIQRSLAGLAQTMAPGGKLVYTGQPWHPQLEFIARVLTSHRKGEDWVMRRRTQLELDTLVAEKGFTKVSGVADQWGIFTVSLAEKA